MVYFCPANRHHFRNLFLYLQCRPLDGCLGGVEKQKKIIMADVFLLRHGSYQNKNNIIPFRLPKFPLDVIGIKQAESTAEFLTDKKIKVIFSSPMLRCRQTAQIIAKKLHLVAKISALINETRSPYQGMNLNKYSSKQKPGFLHSYHLQNKGETYSQIYTRGHKLIKFLLQQHPDKNALLVTHGDTIMSLIYYLIDHRTEVDFSYCAIRTYIPKGGLAKVSFNNGKLTGFNQLNY